MVSVTGILSSLDYAKRMAFEKLLGLVYCQVLENLDTVWEMNRLY